MRVVRVVTNETCNQGCRFCDARRPRERVSIAAAAAVRRRIAQAREVGAAEIVLTGGEPTLRPDLVVLVAVAAREGETRVVLETNARAIDPDLARALADAGLQVARVHLPGWGATLDAITGDRGGAAATEAGLRALAAAGVELEGSAPVVRANLDTLPSLPAALAEAEITLTRLWLRLPRRAPDPRSLAPLPAMLETAERLVEEARAHALPVSLEPATFVPPCQFSRPGRIASIFALNAGGTRRAGYARLPACEGCTVIDRCPGVPTETDLPEASTWTPRPLHDDRLRRRLTMIRSPSAQIERELVTRELYRRPDGTTVPAHIVRINFHCNQACHFCFVSTHLPAPPTARVEAAIDEIAERGGILVLSGGEPTLNPRLLEYVRRGKAHGACEIELQTNATRLAEPARCEALATAGVDTAFVSLHGATAATGDEVTAAPGTWERSAAGLDGLATTSISVRINYVLCELNHRELPDFVDLVAQRWPKAAITISFVGMSTDLVPRERWLVPRYADVIPSLREALDRARRHGVEVSGFDSMCGLPLCLVPDDLRPFFSLAELPSGADGGEFIKPAPCATCVLQSRCFGLRRGYAKMYGWDELQPVTAAPSPSPTVP